MTVLPIAHDAVGVDETPTVPPLEGALARVRHQPASGAHLAGKIDSTLFTLAATVNRPCQESALSHSTPDTQVSSYRLQLPVPARVVVLVSGSGTLLQALLDASMQPGYPARVVAVGADRVGIQGLARAERADVPTFAVRLRDHVDRGAWDVALADAVAAYEPDLVVSAGFMKLAGPVFLARFGRRMLNTHPALLPAFPGAHPVRDALDYGVKVTGCTVHMVDAGVDTGPVIAQEALEVLPGEDGDALHERIKTVERRLLVDVVARLAREGCSVIGREVTIP